MEAKTYRCDGKDNEYSDDEYRATKFAENFIDNNLFKQYCHDIRNLKKFSKEILEKINNLSYENRLAILMIYNEMTEYYISLIDQK